MVKISRVDVTSFLVEVDFSLFYLADRAVSGLQFDLTDMFELRFTRHEYISNNVVPDGLFLALTMIYFVFLLILITILIAH